MKKLFATLTVLTILALSLTACGTPKSEFAYEGPIEGWPSIALPEDVTWDRTVISGKVENHGYTTATSKEDVFTFLEMAMPQNGWTLDASSNSVRNFLNANNDLVNYNVDKNDDGSRILVIIEPVDAYGPPAEEAPEEPVGEADTVPAPMAE